VMEDPSIDQQKKHRDAQRSWLRSLVLFVYSPFAELVLLYDGEAEGVELLEGEIQLVQLRSH
jgi:hypothetical protein